jgi:uncharacterized membrane protein YcaP (DUF421 family)
MKPEEIHIYDLQRILMGEVPGGFLLEVVIRVLFLFLLLIVAIRLMGPKMASSLTRNELAAVTSLAAAIGVPILSPDRGLLPAVIIAAVVIAYQRLISLGIFKSKKLGAVLLDHRNFIIVDGCLNIQEIGKAGLSQERIFAQLRSENIDSLGKVKRLYFEPSGVFTLLEATRPRPGLPIIPEWDQDYMNDRQTLRDHFACCNCGQVVKSRQKPDKECSRCGHNEWREAVQ